MSFDILGLRKTLCLLVLALSCVPQLLAQIPVFIDVSGKVIDADSLMAIPSVHIYIPNTDQGTISNQNGFFSIRMKATDTLVFSAVNYEKTFYILPDSIKRRRPFIQVSMKLRTIRLKEVVVKGQLNPAAVRRYLDNLNQKKKAENPPNIYRHHPESEPKTVPEGREHTVGLGTSLEGGAALEGVLTGLANLFNKRAQQQKRIAKLLEAKRNREAQEAYKDFVASRFNEQIVAEATGLEGARLRQFLRYCNLRDEFIYSASEYELLAAIFRRLYEFESGNR